MRPWLAAVLTAIASLALAQEMTDEQRMAQIMNAFEDRVISQTDIWFDDGEFPTLMQSLRFRVELDPSDYETVTDLSYLYKSTEAYDREIALLTRFRTRNPDSADAAYPEAEFYFTKRAYVRVVDLLNPRLDLKPRLQDNGYRILAHSYSRMGYLKDSLRIWDIYLSLVPGDAAAKVNRQRIVDRMKGAAGIPSK